MKGLFVTVEIKIHPGRNISQNLINGAWRGTGISDLRVSTVD